MVRLFHPDRNPDQAERSVLHTARINAADQTLRDVASRQRYGLSLLQAPETARSGVTPQDFLRPRDPISRFAKRSQTAIGMPIRARAAFLWMVASVLVAGLLFLALREPDQPLLQINPPLADRSAGGTSYMHQIAKDFRWPPRSADRSIAWSCDGRRDTEGGREDEQAGT